MKSISYSKARQNFSNLMSETISNHSPTLITKQNGQACVIISFEDFNSLEETSYLLRSPANAKHLIDSLDSIKQGRIKQIDLNELI